MSCRAQEWFRLIEEYRDSKETVSGFCKRRQISDSALYYWLAKARQDIQHPVKMLPVVTADTKSVDLVELMMPR